MKQQRQGGDTAYIKLMKWEKDCVTEEEQQTAAMQMKRGVRNERTRGKTALFNSRLLQRLFEEAQMLDTKTESENKEAKYSEMRLKGRAERLRRPSAGFFNKKAHGDEQPPHGSQPRWETRG